MKVFTIDMNVAGLPMNLVAIGFVKDQKNHIQQIFQHRHSLFEIQYILEGQCTTKIGDSVCIQRKGETYLIAPGVYHSQKSCSSPFEKLCIMFEIPVPPQDCSKSAHEAFFSLHRQKCVLLNVDNMEVVFNDVKKSA